MAGMMRWSCSRGCCTRGERACDKRTWQRSEVAQVDPWSPWPRSTSRFAEDDALQFGYWSAVLDDDFYLNERARPYLTRSEC